MTIPMKLILTLTLIAWVATTAPSSAQSESRSVEVLLHDNPFHIAPDRILANPGESITFNVYNAGIIGHDFRVCRPEAEGGCNSPVVFVPVLQPGTWGNVTVDMPGPGTYPFECAVPGHADAGMVGELVVGPEKGSPAPGVAAIFVVFAMAMAWRRRSA